MMDLTVTYVAAFVLLAAYFFRGLVTRWRRRQMIRQFDCLPIPKFPSVERFGRDFDREVKESFKNGNVNRTALEHYRRVGSLTYEVHTVTDHLIYTADPLNIQAVSTKLDDWWRDIRRGGFPFFGARISILDQDRAGWRSTRDLVTPLFKRAEVKDIEHFRKFVDRMIARLPRDGRTVDMQPWLRKLFLDSSSEFIFGESLDTLRDTTGRPDDFIEAFNRAVTGAGKRIRPTGLKLLFHSFSASWDRAWLADCKVVHDYIDGCIARHRGRSSPAAAPKTSSSSKRYVLIEGMSPSIPDPIHLRYHLLGIFSLARETAAMAFTNVLFLLARNPEIWSELRAQALALFPLKRSGEEETLIDFAQLSALPPLFRNVINETFRLHAPVTRIRRVAVRDTVLPRGGGKGGEEPAFVPKGTTIWADRFPKSMDPEIWGEDVEVFRPGRWEGKRVGGWTWEFMPFGGGPRMCPASEQVMTQCVYLLVRLVREFETIENRDPCEGFVEGVLMCFASRNGAKVGLIPADADAAFTSVQG